MNETVCLCVWMKVVIHAAHQQIYEKYRLNSNTSYQLYQMEMLNNLSYTDIMSPLTFISVDMVFFMLFRRLIINMDSSETQIYTNIYIPFRKWLKFNQKMNTFNRSLRSPCPNILIYIVVIQSQTGQNIEYCLETLEMSHFLKPN